mmetsp:Transcript_5840/g.6716  ORF Transcript_5840/g.6716 Transcript_5840/m.6716 type:complete len:286 (+) Transcript_5840:233-1090(+)
MIAEAAILFMLVVVDDDDDVILAAAMIAFPILCGIESSKSFFTMTLPLISEISSLLLLSLHSGTSSLVDSSSSRDSCLMIILSSFPVAALQLFVVVASSVIVLVVGICSVSESTVVTFVVLLLFLSLSKDRDCFIVLRATTSLFSRHFLLMAAIVAATLRFLRLCSVELFFLVNDSSWKDSTFLDETSLPLLSFVVETFLLLSSIVVVIVFVGKEEGFTVCSLNLVAPFEFSVMGRLSDVVVGSVAFFSSTRLEFSFSGIEEASSALVLRIVSEVAFGSVVLTLL